MVDRPSRPADREPAGSRPGGGALGSGPSGAALRATGLAVASLLAAVPLALVIDRVHRALPGQGERAVMAVGVVFALCLAAPAAAYLWARRGSVQPAILALVACATLGVLLVAVYLYQISFYVFFPADILIWSESDFVNDILKLRIGYPLYTAQVNNESFAYPPGAQIATYALAWLFGHPTSVETYRVIQVGYTALAALVALACWYELTALAPRTGAARTSLIWPVLGLPFLFLLATNSLTNPFTHALHNDSLVQLVSVVGYWLLLRYARSRSGWVLAAMALLPAVGFLVKQSFVVWVLFYGGYLVLWDRPFSWRRLAGFGLGAGGAVALALGGAYLLWGEPFIYWTITVLRASPTSLLRTFQHVLDTWAYWAIGLVGGLVLLRGRSFDRLVGLWLVWLGLFLVEVYTSGIAWMLNHLGPGSLIAGIWFLAALARLWPATPPGSLMQWRPEVWFRGAAAAGMVCLLLSGLGAVRIPISSLPDDAYRYVAEIEQEFASGSPTDTLLDFGTWLYVKDGIVMKDRAATFGDRGLNGTGDFSGIRQRLEQKYYGKILIRNLHIPDFWYDWGAWPRSSGLREAFLRNYREVGTIAAVAGGDTPGWKGGYGFGDVSILVPRVD